MTIIITIALKFIISFIVFFLYFLKASRLQFQFHISFMRILCILLSFVQTVFDIEYELVTPKIILCVLSLSSLISIIYIHFAFIFVIFVVLWIEELSWYYLQNYFFVVLQLVNFYVFLLIFTCLTPSLWFCVIFVLCIVFIIMILTLNTLLFIHATCFLF